MTSAIITTLNINGDLFDVTLVVREENGKLAISTVNDLLKLGPNIHTAYLVSVLTT